MKQKSKKVPAIKHHNNFGYLSKADRKALVNQRLQEIKADIESLFPELRTKHK